MSEKAFNAEPEVRSPCVSICVLNEAQICLGCGRSRTEIGNWSKVSVEQQKQICAVAEKRMETLV